MLKSDLLPYLVFVVLALLGTLLLDREPEVAASIQSLRTPKVPCEVQTPTTSVGGRLTDAGAVFTHNGFLRMRPCEPGILSVVAVGTGAAGRGAHLLVTAGNDVVWEGELDGEEAIEVTVPEGTYLTLAFLNDLSTWEEDRSLWLYDLSFAPSR
jgi:hypothetical protein